MLSISPKAVRYILAKGRPVYLQNNPMSSSCCISLQEAPSPHFGRPADERQYVEQEIQGITCFLPRDFPEDHELTLTLRNFLGLRWLDLDGWKLL